MSSPSLPLPYTGVWLLKDVIYRALRASGVLKRAQSTPSPEQYQEGFGLINQIVDEWTARKPFAWSTTFTAYTLTPNHQPHLIGPGLTAPDFSVAVRPVKIESCSLILNNVSPTVDVPMNIRDSAWWAGQRVKDIATTVPTDLYPDNGWPSQGLWLWPIPTFAYGLRLETWTALGQFQSINVKFSAPPAYFNALALTLAIAMVTPFEVSMPGELPELHRQAMKAVESNNINSPRIDSADSGTRGRPRGDFNYFSGGPS